MKIMAAKITRMKKVRTQSKKNVHTLLKETIQTKIRKNKKTRILCSTTVTQKWSTLNSAPGRFLLSKHSLKITSIHMVKTSLMKWRMRVYRCLWNFVSKILKTYLSVLQQTMVCPATIQYQAIWSQHSPLNEAIVSTVCSYKVCLAHWKIWRRTRHWCRFSPNRIQSPLKPRRFKWNPNANKKSMTRWKGCYSLIKKRMNSLKRKHLKSRRRKR